MNAKGFVGALAGLALATVVGTSALSAQVPGVPGPPSLGIHLGVKVTTLGLGGEVGIGIGPRLGFRAGVNGFKLARDLDFDDIDYSVDLKLLTVSGLVDLYLVGPLRLSGGLIINKNKLELSADPTVSVEIGNTTYQAADVGTLTGKIDYSRTAAPYLGLGIGGRGRIGFLLEAGLMFTGTPRVTYGATTTLTGAAATQFVNQVQIETANVQADVADSSILKLWPVFGIGLQIGI